MKKHIIFANKLKRKCGVNGKICKTIKRRIW